MTDQVREAVTAERRAQVEILAGLRPEQWDAPTLCAGWRVREVVAHTTMPFRMGTGRFLAEMLRAGGRCNRMADRVARREAETIPAQALLTSLRENLAHPWTRGPAGAAQDLLLVVCGRRLPPGHLTGPDAHRFQYDG